MKDIHYMAAAEDSIRKMNEGAFLTVKSDKGLNTMTIGWATLGVVWSKRIMMVAVRPSRHTFGIIEAAKDFTVTVPAGGMGRELAFCGSQSGRVMDKFKGCGLSTAEAQKVESPIIKAPGRHYECRIVYKTAIDQANLDGAVDAAAYPKKDYHTLYFGEIVACYETD